MNKDFEQNIYRILSELINNTVKHADADTVKINLRNNDNTLFLLYSDNGKGFDVEKERSENSKGNGVKNIFNRVKTINGVCKMVSNKELGFMVRIKVDIQKYIVK